MRYFLVDNGSLKAESVLNLREVAAALSQLTGHEIIPASLLHSSKIDPAQLGGEGAINLEKRLRLLLETGEREFTLIPFFFGPTAAITDYLPLRLAWLRERHGDFSIRRTPFLYDEKEGNERLLGILADNVRRVIESHRLCRPRVTLLDHGSPLPEVTAVRDALAQQLQALLAEGISDLSPSSMERRPGEAYAFNEPLLESLLRQESWNKVDVVVAMLFLSPGRHAGPGGDVDTICRSAEQASPGLRTYMTGLAGTHPGILQLLADRLQGVKVAM